MSVIDCPRCKGTGKETIDVVENGTKRSSFKMACGFCEETGKTTQEAVDAAEKANREFWCACGNPSGDIEYYEYEDGAHGYTCRDCGKVVQVG